MYLFQTFFKKRYPKEWVGSVWKCNANIESDATYYKLFFSSEIEVEGWVKYKTDSEETNVFTAAYNKSKNLLEFKKGKELFVGICHKNKISAMIDGHSLQFFKTV
jgi:hypothetical protein